MRFFPKTSARPLAQVRRALGEVARERRERGYRNEDRLFEAVSNAAGSGESTPHWFSGFRRASVADDLRRATDFFLTAKVWIESQRQVREFNFPLNAKSSDRGVAHLRSGRSSLGRDRHDIVPIVGFVVDPYLGDAALREKLWAAFAGDQLLREWLARRGWRLIEPCDVEEIERRRAKKNRARKVTDGGEPIAAPSLPAEPAPPEEASGHDVPPPDDPPKKEKPPDPVKLAIGEARAEANGIALDISATEAETVIGVLFGRRFRSVREEWPTLAEDPLTAHRFIDAAKQAFLGWRRRAARSAIAAA